MRTLIVVAIVICGVGSVGCSTAHGPAMGKAVGGAAGAVVGHKYGETSIGKSVGSQLGGVAGELTKSAGKVERAPRQSPARTQKGEDRFCPTGGERYAQGFKYCPFHGDELRTLER